MISADYDRPHLYAYVGGMVNQVWLAGIAGDIDTKSNPVKFKLYQNSNPNLALPIELKPGDYLPHMVKEGIAVKVEGHVFGRKLESGERIAVVRAIKITPPTLLDMPGELAWKASIDGINGRKWPDGVPESPFTPEFKEPSDSEVKEMIKAAASTTSHVRFAGPRSMPNLFMLAEGEGAADVELFRDRLKLRQAANVVRVAGIVDGAFMAIDTNGREQNDTLVVLLRQNTDSDRSIPVRVYNRHARKIHDLVRIGTPVLVLGSYRQRVKVVSKADTPGGADIVNCLPYVHTNHIRVATAEDIKIVPAWAEELARKMSAARFSSGRSTGGQEKTSGDQTRRRPLPVVGSAVNDPGLDDAISRDIANLTMADED